MLAASMVILHLTGQGGKFQDTRTVSSKTTRKMLSYQKPMEVFINNICFSLRCKDERYLLKRPNGKLNKDLSATCRWSQTWSLSLTDLTCELTFCRPDPVPPVDSQV